MTLTLLYKKSGEMAEEVKVLATLPEGLSLLPSTYVRVLHNCQ